MAAEPITSQTASKAKHQMKACTLKSGKLENNSASNSSGNVEVSLPSQRSRQLHSRTKPAGMAQSKPRWVTNMARSDVLPGHFTLIVLEGEDEVTGVKEFARAVPQIAKQGKPGKTATEKEAGNCKAFSPTVKRDAGDKRGHEANPDESYDVV